MREYQKWPFKGICLSAPRQADYEMFKRVIAEVLPSLKCNNLVLLLRYRFDFKKHPEVVDKEPITLKQAQEISNLCRQNNIRIIPKMNLFGHQSEKGGELRLGLLRAYPDFDETPDLPTVRYCRSLCPRHPKVKEVIYSLIDEVIDAFKADAIHVGCDEVFEIGLCPRCKGTPNHQLFAEWINILHSHIVRKRKVEMFMWGDRLLDARTTGYGEWEASENDTYNAIDNIPKDIILCDWHYKKMESYPSIQIFVNKGFKIVICPWKNLEATKAFLEFAAKNNDKKILGVLQTSWCDSGAIARYLLNIEDVPKLVLESFKFSMNFF
jgi:hypothetical protein